jgi:anti-sigma B factor antagonist
MLAESKGEVLAVTGATRLTADHIAWFREVVRVHLKPEHRFVEIDLTNVKTIDSDGIGELMAIYKRVREREGNVRLLHPTPFVQRLFEILKLDGILELIP